MSPRKTRGACIGLEIVDNGDKGGDFSGCIVENKFYGVKKSLSPIGSSCSNAVSNLSHVDPSGLLLATSRNGSIQLLLLSSSCFLYSLVGALSSLALSLAAFLTDADRE